MNKYTIENKIIAVNWFAAMIALFLAAVHYSLIMKLDNPDTILLQIVSVAKILGFAALPVVIISLYPRLHFISIAAILDGTAVFFLYRDNIELAILYALFVAFAVFSAGTIKSNLLQQLKNTIAEKQKQPVPAKTTDEQIFDLRTKGKTQREIAEELNISLTKVNRTLNAA